MRRQAGFTLIEIAIVLVIVGLLLGGVLKGQELITSARVRNVASQLEGVKIAYLGFQDRYRSLPGDYANAQAGANIPGPTTTLGCTGANCQNGRIDAGVGVGVNESILAWHQLGRAGFINGSFDGVGDSTAPSPLNSPTNPFGGNMQIVFDRNFSDAVGTTDVFNVKTGTNVPSGIVAEIDRKIDDGVALTGSFRSASLATGGTAAWEGSTASCLTASPAFLHNAAQDIKTCGGVALQ